MNHLESAFKSKNSFWRYLVMFVAVLLASNFIGGIPLIISYVVKAASNPEIISGLAANPSDIGVIGLDPNVGLVMMLIPSVAGIIAFILLIKPLNERTFRQVINGTGSVRWKRFFISALVWAVLSGVYLIVSLKLYPSNFTLNNSTISLIWLSIISLLFIPFQASLEEILFRGYLMQGFAVLARNRWFPLLITSVLFGLMHCINPEVKEYGFLTMMAQYMLSGLVFGIATILDDGIEVAMGAHAANNIFLCIFVTNSSSVLQSSALYEQKTYYPWTEFIGLLIASTVFLIVLKVIFKWEGFSRLFGKVSAREEVVQTV
jgi:membrane protease YdiL (CAAX protease family)